MNEEEKRININPNGLVLSQGFFFISFGENASRSPVAY